MDRRGFSGYREPTAKTEPSMLLSLHRWASVLQVPKEARSARTRLTMNSLTTDFLSVFSEAPMTVAGCWAGFEFPWYHSILFASILHSLHLTNGVLSMAAFPVVVRCSHRMYWFDDD